MIIYKVRRKTDGLFSMGGTTPSFGKKGKSWQHKGYLTRHLQELYQASKKMYLRDCEIVQYELTEVELDPIDIVDYIKEVSDNKAKKQADAKRKMKDYQKAIRKQEFEKLKLEFGE